jgi:hypothetical protein
LPAAAPPLNVLSQLDSHLVSLTTLSELPSISELRDGAYLSAQREFIPSSFPDPGCSAGALLLLFDFAGGGCCRFRALSSFGIRGDDDDDDGGFLAYGLDIAAVVDDDEDVGLA